MHGEQLSFYENICSCSIMHSAIITQTTKKIENFGMWGGGGGVEKSCNREGL